MSHSMSLQEAREIICQPEPEPEDNVDLCCSHCAGMWNSKQRGYDRERHFTHRKYIGNEYCTWDDKEVFLCPNGCTDYFGQPIHLEYVYNTGTLTPADQWKIADLYVRWSNAQRKADALEKELGNYGMKVGDSTFL